jgi:hypothetical protein
MFTRIKEIGIIINSRLAIVSTSGRLHSEFVRLLFLQAHRGTDRFGFVWIKYACSFLQAISESALFVLMIEQKRWRTNKEKCVVGSALHR